MFCGVTEDPDGLMVSQPQVEGTVALNVVAVAALTLNTCELAAAVLNVSDVAPSVRLPVPPPPVPPLTVATTGTVILEFAAPLALTTIDPELTPFGRDAG